MFELNKIIENFFDNIGWYPNQHVQVVGKYSEYYDSYPLLLTLYEFGDYGVKGELQELLYFKLYMDCVTTSCMIPHFRFWEPHLHLKVNKRLISDRLLKALLSVGFTLELDEDKNDRHVFRQL